MPRTIRVRDVARGATHELGPEVPALRGPYELFQPTGAVRRRGDLVDYCDGPTIKTGRVAPAMLGDVRPGERVLLRLEKDPEDAWWLCEVVAVDGVAAA